MNTAQLKKNVGQMLRLRPHPRTEGIEIPEIPSLLPSTGLVFRRKVVDTDYKWRLEKVDAEGVTLFCPSTYHRTTLGADNVREFRTPDFLMLKCQLTLDGSKVRVEPF